MKIRLISAAGGIACIFIWILPLHSQIDESFSFSRLNSNVAFTVSAPLNPTAKYTTTGWGFVYGAGYNFDRHHSVIGEAMWNRLSATNGALAPLRTALQSNNINGHGNLVALTANYRLQFERKIFGTYFIAGGGVYYRDASLSQHVTVGNSVACTPVWPWWGFTCSSGTVTSNQRLAGSSSTAPGANAGIGFTVRVADSRYKFYVEARYHYASQKFITTQIIPITVGVRF
jgi:outer membrane protein with beta-barrel domain